MEQDLTTGSVFKRIVYFSLPYLLSYFLQTLYGMADLFITGQFYGVDTITAVSNGSQIMHMMTVIIVGLAMGTTVTIGHSVGAKCGKGSKEFHTDFTYDIVGTNQESAKYTQEYMHIREEILSIINTQNAALTADAI